MRRDNNRGRTPCDREMLSQLPRSGLADELPDAGIAERLGVLLHGLAPVGAILPSLPESVLDGLVAAGELFDQGVPTREQALRDRSSRVGVERRDHVLVERLPLARAVQGGVALPGGHALAAARQLRPRLVGV